jgi:Flp pilus assembly protein TadG
MSSERRKRRSGNALIEMALIFIPMIALMFGIIDFSFAIFLQSTFSSACREGTRFAITDSTTYNGTDCTVGENICIAQVVQTNAVGFLSGTKAQYIYVNYYAPSNMTTPVMSCNLGTCTLNGTLPSGILYPNQSANIVEVTVTNYPYLWLVPIHVAQPTAYMTNVSQGNGLSLSAASVDVMGGTPVGLGAPPSP